MASAERARRPQIRLWDAQTCTELTQLPPYHRYGWPTRVACWGWCTFTLRCAVFAACDHWFQLWKSHGHCLRGGYDGQHTSDESQAAFRCCDSSFTWPLCVRYRLGVGYLAFSADSHRLVSVGQVRRGGGGGR
jgi:hypothetical protein